MIYDLSLFCEEENSTQLSDFFIFFSFRYLNNNQLCGDLPTLSPAASTLSLQNNHWNCPLPPWCTGGRCNGQVSNCETIPFGVCVSDTVIDFVVSTPTSAQVFNSNSNFNAFVVAGTGENGATYTITIPNATPSQQSGTVSGGVWQQTFNIASLPDGSVTIGIQASDIAENSLSESRSFTKDTVIDFVVSTPTSGQVFISNSNLDAFVVAGTGENEATYTITIPNATPSQQSGTVSGGVWQQTFNIAS